MASTESPVAPPKQQAPMQNEEEKEVPSVPSPAAAPPAAPAPSASPPLPTGAEASPGDYPPAPPPAAPGAAPVAPTAAQSSKAAIAAAAAAAAATTRKKPKAAKKTPAPAKKKRGKRGANRPTFVVKLGPNDVLMGRGSLFADYEGNVRLRNVVTEHRDAYSASSKHKDKQAIVRSIIEAVQSLGGRFLRRVDLNKEQKKLHQDPSVLWTVVDDEKMIIDKVKQLFRDARLVRRLRHVRKTPDGTGEFIQTEITAPRLFANSNKKHAEESDEDKEMEDEEDAPPAPPQPRPPGITAAPGTVEEQLQLQRLRQQEQKDQQNPLDEQLKQKAFENQMKLQAQQQRKQNKQNKKAAAREREAKGAEDASLPEPSPPQPPAQELPQLQIPNMPTTTTGLNLNTKGMNLSQTTGMNLNTTTGMNATAPAPAGMNLNATGMNLNSTGTTGMNFNTLNFSGNMANFGGDMPSNFMFQRKQHELAALQQERDRQELAELELLRAQQERQQNDLRQQQEFQAFRERQELELFRAQQERQQNELRQQQALRQQQEQELANLLQANQAGDSLRQFATQQPMGMMQNEDRAQLGYPASFGAFPPDSLNRVNNTGVGRSGLVDLARLAELMQVTGQYPNQFNNQGGQPM